MFLRSFISLPILPSMPFFDSIRTWLSDICKSFNSNIILQHIYYHQIRHIQGVPIHPVSKKCNYVRNIANLPTYAVAEANISLCCKTTLCGVVIESQILLVICRFVRARALKPLKVSRFTPSYGDEKKNWKRVFWNCICLSDPIQSHIVPLMSRDYYNSERSYPRL